MGVAEVQDVERALFWRLDGDRPAARVWTSGVDENASVDGCVASTVDDETLLTGETGGTPTLWTTADGTSFDAVALGETGTSVGRMRSVTSGFAAAGQRTGGDGAWTGAVVHLSTDGRTWRTLRVPATRYTDAVDVVPVGKDLVVAGDTDGGPQLWLLRDYAAQL